MEKLIDVVNKLQGVFSTTNIGDLNTEIQLPQIVVIGAQSSGKSSVLEGIVGKDFLPRGTGIVTRRPLILHLNYCAPDDPLRSKYSKWKGIFKTVGPETDFAFFEHKPNQIFVRFNEVYEEIEADTDRVAGTNRGICPKPIILSIYSHKVVQLSLVDLPGITKVPVGDQPRDIEKQIHQMIMKYIVNPNAIILAVSAANVDFATSEAIKLAQEVDPQGERTLAVLTKLDLMDKGTNAMNVLAGNVIPIKRGIVGVINRSQEDIDNKKEIEACWEYEKQFLQQKYPSISHQNGIKYLAGILHKMLMEHIQACLPELKARINEYIKKCTKEMEQLGDANIDPHAKLLDLNNRFVRAYNETIMGVGDGMDMIKEFTMDDDLFGGAKISWIFHTEYGQDLDAINLANELKTEYIHRAVLQTGGLHPSIIVPEKCFEALSSHQIKRLEEPSLNCVDRVHEEMKKAIGYCGKEDLIHELKRFPAFAEKIYNFMIHLLDERAKETKKFIQQLVESHVAFINTKHPDFSSERALLIMLMKLEPNVQQVAQYHASREMNSIGAKLVNEMKETDGEIEEIYAGEIAKKMSKRDWQNCILIRRLVKAYFKIVRKAVQDQTPKQIYSELIHHVKEKLSKGSLMQIFKDSDINKLFLEDEEVSQRRFEMEIRLDTLQKAAEVLDALSIYYTF